MKLLQRIWSALCGNVQTRRHPDEPIYVFTGRDAAIDPSNPRPELRPNGMLILGRRRCEIYIDGDPAWHRYPWIDSMLLGGARHPLGFDMFACPDNENVPHRAEVEFVSCLETVYPLATGIRRFVGFSFLLDPASEIPRNWALIAQVWQFSRKSPPFELGLRMGKPGDPFVLLFTVRNDSEERVFFTREIVKGTWYRLALELLPAHVDSENAGRIGVWFWEPERGDAGAPCARYEGFWGYAFGPTSRGRQPRNPVHGAYDLFDIRFGVYRRKQERRLKVFFDHMAYGDSLSSVLGEPPPREVDQRRKEA